MGTLAPPPARVSTVSPRPGNSVTAASAVAPSVSPGARDKSGSQLALSVAIFLL